jgi:hypothetical protein
MKRRDNDEEMEGLQDETVRRSILPLPPKVVIAYGKVTKARRPKQKVDTCEAP